MSNTKDSFLQPSYNLKNRFARFLWGVIYILLFKFSPTPFHNWRSFLLSCFGAKLSKNCHIYPKAEIWAPWNLECEDTATIADNAIIYNTAKVYLASHSTVSYQAYLCCATHDYNDPDLPVVSVPIRIGRYAWVCARATVMPGITIAEGAVLGLGAVATKDLDAWTVYAGTPAKKIKSRVKIR